MGRHQVQVHAVIKNFLGLCSSSSGGTGDGDGGGSGVNEVELLERRRTVCTAPHHAAPVEALLQCRRHRRPRGCAAALFTCLPSHPRMIPNRAEPTTQRLQTAIGGAAVAWRRRGSQQACSAFTNRLRSAFESSLRRLSSVLCSH